MHNPDLSLAVQATNLTVRRGATEILHGVDFRAYHGHITGIIGPNGCGKSTLIRACLGLIPAEADCLSLDGKQVGRSSARDIARTASLLAQHATTQLDLTVADIVSLGRIPHGNGWARPPREPDRIVEQAMELTGAADLRDRMWDGLSGGERQRVQLARAFAQQPRILFVDEPTNHLDPAAAWHLMESIRGLDVTVVGAFHDLNLAARFCDRLVVMQAGVVVREGTPAEVLTAPLLRQVYGIEAAVTTHPAGGPLIIQTGVC